MSSIPPLPRRPECWIITDGMESPHGTEMLAALLAEQLVRRGWRVEMWMVHHRRKTSVYYLHV